MNNGSYAIKGYLYQYLICILDSFQDDWNSIIVESNTKRKKVDILWLFETQTGKYQKVVQVSSTQDIFDEEEIQFLAEELKHNFKDADEYKLILVGRVLRTLLECLCQNEERYAGVQIPAPKIFDLEVFISWACHKLDRYIDDNFATQLYWWQRENLVFNLIEKLQYYSTDRKEITRIQFEYDLQEWVQSYANFNDYELKANTAFIRYYGFTAPPKLRAAIEKFDRQSRKSQRLIFKECANFLDVDLNTGELKIVYSKADKMLFSIGSWLQAIVFIQLIWCAYFYITIHTDWIFLLLALMLSVLLIAIVPLVRPYYLARRIEREIKEIHQKRAEFENYYEPFTKCKK